MHRRKSLATAIVALIAAGAFASSAAADATPPSLQAQMTTNLWFPDDFAGFTDTCTSPTSGGTVTASTSGWSGVPGPSGPNQLGLGGEHGGLDGRQDHGVYGGTYTLDETLTFAPDSGVVSDVAGRFTIASQLAVVAADGTTTYEPVTVAGTISHLAPDTMAGDAGCGLAPLDWDASTVAFDVWANYSATITLASGASYLDAGTVNIYHYRCGGSPGRPCANGVNFTSYSGEVPTPAPAPPALPTTKSQCQDNGWKTFPAFKNQGDCVKSVASKGKKS